MRADDRASDRLHRWTRNVTIWAAILAAGAVGVGVVRLAGSEPALGADDQIGGSLAFMVVFLSPALVALTARQGRRVALWSAGIALLMLSMISIATFVLIVVAVAFIVLGVRSPFAPATGMLWSACS